MIFLTISLHNKYYATKLFINVILFFIYYMAVLLPAFCFLNN